MFGHLSLQVLMLLKGCGKVSLCVTMYVLLQIIDMGLPQDAEAVLGAALSWENGRDVLLILAETQLRTYSIKVS